MTSQSSRRPALALVMVLVVISIGAAVLAFGSRHGGGVSHSVTGGLTLNDPYHLQSPGYSTGDVCRSAAIGDGYSDIAAGAPVTVKDGNGHIGGTSSLGDGRWTAQGCRFPFTVSASDSAFYAIEVSHRGALTYSNKDLAVKRYQVEFSLG